ncbi:uracil-DNA glycosylase family protein [Mobilitalea sibirica]|uniref:Uracil-DNA glycosylase family protein n=1 Tax=Mobilitalea sibirica TaxID=1462919 RepID=A0A8J7HCK6_9FIRM|nr:uracil-DNA glycosylase family protein [Mobilitalea sibirica]MBH1941062.1 uracil-DNA glycosylase family protein [Mobilitalea sibirica]
MLDEIINCRKCNMCNNQLPLLDKVDECDVMWVGLSAKEVKNVMEDTPLSASTKSGGLISEIETEVKKCKYYKTNVVKCLPLDRGGKLRYPTRKEMDLCITNLFREIEILKPKIIFLLGKNVIKAFENNIQMEFDDFNDYNYKMYQFGNMRVIPIHHPSYISVYKVKSKENYIEAVKNLITFAL